MSYFGRKLSSDHIGQDMNYKFAKVSETCFKIVLRQLEKKLHSFFDWQIMAWRDHFANIQPHPLK